jgi:hypothetical protein
MNENIEADIWLTLVQYISYQSSTTCISCLLLKYITLQHDPPSRHNIRCDYAKTPGKMQKIPKRGDFEEGDLMKAPAWFAN